MASAALHLQPPCPPLRAHKAGLPHKVSSAADNDAASSSSSLPSSWVARSQVACCSSSSGDDLLLSLLTPRLLPKPVKKPVDTSGAAGLTKPKRTTYGPAAAGDVGKKDAVRYRYA